MDFFSAREVAGRPAVSYYHAATGDLRFARAGNGEGSSWPAGSVVTVDGLSENVGWYTSLAVIGGVPAISYQLRRAWVSEFQALPEFDANNMNTVGIQTITLQHEGFVRDEAVAEPAET